MANTLRSATAGSLLLLLSCASSGADSAARGGPPIAGAAPADALIHEGERHFARLWKLTSGGENAEGYFSFAGDRLVLQRRDPAAGVSCDRIFVTGASGALTQVSDGRGVTTCSYFMPGDAEVLYSSTRAHMESCPPSPDYSQGYVWVVHPEHDIWVSPLAGGEPRRLTDAWGYDAEATVSPRGDRIVFTSTRSGDLELWTMALDGSDARQVTHAPGYDGGAFFSHDGTRLVYRRTQFTPGAEEAELADYRAILADWKIRPKALEIWVIGADGEDPRQVTQLGGANWAPYFFPDDRRIVFTSNHQDPRGRAFDLFAIGVGGEDLERITTYDGFDGFPMFSPDGRYLVFASNRGGTTAGETNLFLAEWRP